MNVGNVKTGGDAVFTEDTRLLRQLFGLDDQDHWCELIPDALLFLDEQRRILYFNRAAATLFEHALPAVGEPARNNPSLKRLLDELRLDALETRDTDEGAERLERVVQWSKGTARIPMEAVVSSAWRGGRRLFMLTLRQRPEEHGGESKALYQSQKRQVIGALAGGIAHDFNNILTAVIGNLDLALSDERIDPMVRQALTQAIDSARRGAELNMKLLSFSRQTDVRPASVNLARMIEETVFILRRSIDPRVRIKCEPVPNDLWPAWVDEGQFMQVLMNLCLNARDAMPKGGDMTFKLANCLFTAATVRQSWQAGEFVRVTVSDTGEGMPPEVLERLFEPYFTTKEFGKGAGLGLSIANHVVVENGGWIEVESEIGKGSQFHLFLPRSKAVSPVPAPERQIPKSAAGAALEGTETILVVDDEQSIRTVMHAVLSYRGYKVLSAADGADGLEKFRAARNSIRLVLLDLQMPNMNGWDTMERILELSPKTPVLLLSGGSSDPPDGGASMAKAAGLLRKPFASAELLRTVRGVLDAANRPA